MYEQHRSRGRGGLVLIAVVLLTALGIGVGLLIANLGGKPSQNADNGNVNTGATVGPTRGTDPEPTVEPPNPGKPCPEHTQEIASSKGIATPLSQVVFLETANSQVWICTDSGGALYYQGFRKGDGPEMIEGENALFLTGAEKTRTGYRAVNRDAVYNIYPDRLEIGPDGMELTPEYATRSEGF